MVNTLKTKKINRRTEETIEIIHFSLNFRAFQIFLGENSQRKSPLFVEKKFSYGPYVDCFVSTFHCFFLVSYQIDGN